jgi:hypothetical protein
MFAWFEKWKTKRAVKKYVRQTFRSGRLSSAVPHSYNPPRGLSETSDTIFDVASSIDFGDSSSDCGGDSGGSDCGGGGD